MTSTPIADSFHLPPADTEPADLAPGSRALVDLATGQPIPRPASYLTGAENLAARHEGMAAHRSELQRREAARAAAVGRYMLGDDPAAAVRAVEAAAAEDRAEAARAAAQWEADARTGIKPGMLGRDPLGPLVIGPEADAAALRERCLMLAAHTYGRDASPSALTAAAAVFLAWVRGK